MYVSGNKSKTVRRASWHVATPPDQQNRKAAHTWCRKFESDGKFYHHYTNTRWWFEKVEDAMWFSLQGF